MPKYAEQFQRLRCGFVGFGRSTFDTNMAEEILQRSKSSLELIGPNICAHDSLITSTTESCEVADLFKGKIDVLIAQFATFVDARMIEAMCARLRVPVVIWAIREPKVGGRQRLALNSLTGANLAGNRLRQMNIPFQFVYGDPFEDQLNYSLRQALKVFWLYLGLRSFTIISVGDSPDGFRFSTPSSEVVERLGITIKKLELEDVFRSALEIPDEEVAPYVEAIRQKVNGIDNIPIIQVYKFAKMKRVIQEEARRVRATAAAIRCWPEFFTEFGAAACSVVSALTDDGIMTACESDILGSLSMDVLSKLSEAPAYLGDLVEVDDQENALVFWHCGAGAFSLARGYSGPEAGVHPNRRQGLTLEFGLKPGPVTVLRIGEDGRGGVRALIAEGEMLDRAQRFLGTCGVMRLYGEGDTTKRVKRIVELGFEPHYALAYGHFGCELERLCALIGVPVTRF